MKKFVVLVKGDIVFRGSEKDCAKHVLKNRILHASVVPATTPKHL